MVYAKLVRSVWLFFWPNRMVLNVWKPNKSVPISDVVWNPNDLATKRYIKAPKSKPLDFGHLQYILPWWKQLSKEQIKGLRCNIWISHKQKCQLIQKYWKRIKFYIVPTYIYAVNIWNANLLLFQTFTVL